ncbi:DUF4974 domain-containing protein [Dyella monticola]|uniref:DUF4974 domain-containing protein n=1 Tax=Dyella monticola TaxID=1927958 RepID=A0A370WTF3_9GAMM|nr:FecR domain-containing protein [Dyella monticola]RDS79306.1 DUF4974 domain-containing protein [Dyella monticola]
MAHLKHDTIVSAAADWWVRLREPDAEGKHVEQWLTWVNEDERHLAAFERMNDLAERLGTLDQVSRQSLIKAFAASTAAGRRLGVWWAAAASILVAVLAGGGYVAWMHARPEIATQVYQSGIGQNRDIVLSDGTRVALGAASTLSVRYGKDERDVTLSRGEAFFEVVHDSQHPFAVDAGDVSVRDIGTAFDVRRTDRRVTVAVTQGRVAIADRRANQQGTLEAGAGERVSYDPESSGMSVSSVSPEQVASWRHDRLEFIDEPLNVVVANLNRYTEKPLHIADADLGKLVYTGSIRIDAIDSWITALPDVFPLRVSQQANGVTLSDAQPRVHR